MTHVRGVHCFDFNCFPVTDFEVSFLLCKHHKVSSPGVKDSGTAIEYSREVSVHIRALREVSVHIRALSMFGRCSLRS